MLVADVATEIAVEEEPVEARRVAHSASQTQTARTVCASSIVAGKDGETAEAAQDVQDAQPA